MKYTYLALNFLTILFPLALSFDKRVQFYKSYKYLLPAIGVTGLLFLVWDILFTRQGVWSFNAQYIIGINLLGLPIEEILFFITVPFACLFIYACLNYYVKKILSDLLCEIISAALLAFSILVLIFQHQKLYTLVTFGLLTVLLVLCEYVWRLRWLNRFYMAYVVVLLPFYAINGALTAIPVVMYNNAQNLGIRVGSIPLEDHFYCMGLLLMNTALFEFFKKRKTATT